MVIFASHRITLHRIKQGTRDRFAVEKVKSSEQVLFCSIRFDSIRFDFALHCTVVSSFCILLWSVFIQPSTSTITNTSLRLSSFYPFLLLYPYLFYRPFCSLPAPFVLPLPLPLLLPPFHYCDILPHTILHTILYTVLHTALHTLL